MSNAEDVLVKCIQYKQRNLYLLSVANFLKYSFAEKSHLVRHYSFHSEQRPYKCEICQKMYKTERCLKVHGMVHSSERRFVCSYCSKGFLSSTKLKVGFCTYKQFFKVFI